MQPWGFIPRIDERDFKMVIRLTRTMITGKITDLEIGEILESIMFVNTKNFK